MLIRRFNRYFSKMEGAKKIVLDPFCFKQFEPKEDGTPAAIDFNKEELTEKVNSYYIEKGTDCLKPGYAPFCKHIFMENFTPALQSTAEITDENKGLLQCAYEARRENELAVLTRWFPQEHITATTAKYLDIILYSYDQVQSENESMSTEDPNKDIGYDYAIISIKPQGVDFELPMQPITMMRNSLGKEYGGSGVPFDEDKYKESVKYWESNALIK
ncbi:unnamed protein product [Moneuplotes crassus]|uniref:Uncharacterized protein n=2 Tax=Euplotes crassus TaxID=5936 RepID=A0AAD2D4K6_EUPCR|nr:unnamed protein product [Moneuplotes crassus]